MAAVHSKNLLINYISLLGGTVLAKSMGLITVLILTRYLGVEEFGLYSLAFSFWALLNTLVDLGGSHIAGRELAKEADNPRASIESIIYLRLLGCLLFLPVGFWVGQWLGLSDGLIWVVIVGLFAGFEAYYDVYFSATMQLDKAAKGRFIASIANVALIALSVLLKASLLVIVLIALLNPLIKLALDYRYAGFVIKLQAPDWNRIRTIFLDGWPLWLGGLQYIILARVDILMLQSLSPMGHYDVGIYSAAFRFSEVMALLINAMCPALLPLLVKYMDQSEQVRFLAGTGIRLILTVLMAMSLLIFWYAPWIVKVYGPGYEGAAACMRILIWSQAFVAVNALCYYLLLVYNAQGKRPVILSNILFTALNIGLNFWLIPILKAEGAAWATVFTEIAILGGMLLFVRAYTPIRLGKDILWIEGLALASCVPVALLGGAYGWLSVVLFVAFVWMLRLLKPADLKRLAQERLHPAPPNPK